MATLPNSSFDKVSTHTLQNFQPVLVENIMTHEAFYWQLEQRSMVTEKQGGRSIVVPLMYGDNDTVQSYSGYDLLNVAPQEGFTNAEYGWRYASGAVTISGQEEFENSGDANRVFDLLDGKLKQLELSFKKKLNLWLVTSDGSGNDAKDFQGLPVAVEEGTAWSVYGGIDGANFPFWRNRFINFTGSGNTSFNTTAGKSVEGLAVFRRMRNLTTIGKMRPSLIMTTMDIYEAYEANLEGDKLRFVDTKMKDAGFANITFSDIPLVYDNGIPSGYAYFLNAEHFKLVFGRGRKFVTTPFVKPPNQDAKVATTLLTGNLVVSRRDVNGLITNLATP